MMRRARTVPRRATALLTLVAVSLSLVACATGGGGGAGGAQTLTIGLLAPLTGIMAPLGEALKQGTEIGVQAVNAQGGIGGKQVRLLIEDDKGDPATAAERAKKLVEGDRVDILMGTISSATTLAVIPVVNKNKIPFIYVIEGEDKTCLSGDVSKTNPYVFANGYTPQMMWTAVADELVKRGKKWYFIGNDYVFPRTVNEVGIRLMKAKGVEIVGDDYLPLGTTEFSTTIAKIEQAKPDVLWSTVVGSDAIAFAKQAKQFGLYDKMTVAGSAAFAIELYPGLKGSVEGQVVAVDRYTDTLDNSENAAFVERFNATFKPQAPIGPVAAGGGYGTMLMLQAAAEKAGSTEPAALQKALEGLKVQLPQGEVEIEAQTHIAKMNIYMMEITSDGKYQVMKESGLVQHPGHEDCSVQ